MKLPILPIMITICLLTGCSQEIPGAATPGTAGGGDRPAIPTEGAQSEPYESSGDSGTAQLQPCALLADDELAQLRLGDEGFYDEIAGQRGCRWTASGSHTVTVSVADEYGLADVQSTGPTTPMKIGSHDALRSTGGISSCAINLGVTETSRVDVISSANGDTSKACAIAERAAELVEPKLP